MLESNTKVNLKISDIPDIDKFKIFDYYGACPLAFIERLIMEWEGGDGQCGDAWSNNQAGA
jgi:hypothetical protein